MTRVITTFTMLFVLAACSQSNSDEPAPAVSTGKLVKEIMVNGTSREFIIYIPESYNRDNEYPLLFSFHGLTSNMEFNYNYTQFNELADSENFILIHPNGLSNKWTVSSTNNPDIDFVEAIIENVTAEYNINAERIYSTGMSNGGFFSFSLACGLSERIAAIASVTGSMYGPSINSCSPTRPIAILQIHGTEDNIVPYTSVPNLLDHWTAFNNTDSAPQTFNLPDLDPSDGSTIERFEYLNGDNQTEVHHLKVIGGGHQWPGYKGNMDIDASKEAWEFVKRFNLKGKVN